MAHYSYGSYTEDGYIANGNYGAGGYTADGSFFQQVVSHSHTTGWITTTVETTIFAMNGVQQIRETQIWKADSWGSYSWEDPFVMNGGQPWQVPTGQHYNKHRHQRRSACVISNWAKLFVAFRFVQESKRLNHMYQIWLKSPEDPEPESESLEDPEPESEAPDLLTRVKILALSDELKKPQSCSLELYNIFRTLLYVCPTLKFSTSMVLNYLRDVLVFDLAKWSGYAGKKEFRKHLTKLVCSIPVVQSLHVEQLKESKETSLPDKQPPHVQHVIEKEESKFVNSWCKLHDSFPVRE